MHAVQCGTKGAYPPHCMQLLARPFPLETPAVSVSFKPCLCYVTSCSLLLLLPNGSADSLVLASSLCVILRQPHDIWLSLNSCVLQHPGMFPNSHNACLPSVHPWFPCADSCQSHIMGHHGRFARCCAESSPTMMLSSEHCLWVWWATTAVVCGIGGLTLSVLR